MKRKFEWGAVAFTVCVIFIVRFGLLEGPAQYVYVDLFSNSSLRDVSAYWTYRESGPRAPRHPDRNANDPAMSPPQQMSLVLTFANSSSSRMSLGAWGGLKRMLNRSDLSAEVEESFREGLRAWRSLAQLVDAGDAQSTVDKKNDRQCPHSVSITNATEIAAHSPVDLPCGLILDSWITVLGTPLPGSSDFQIELIGANAPGESGRHSIILHYNVRLQGDKLTDQAVIIQNTWTSRNDWEEEERCPSPVELNPSQVDGLDRCVDQVGKVLTWKPPAGKESGANGWPSISPTKRAKPWFPFAEGMPFAVTILAGWEGFQVTVNGKHISSFQYRQGYEPWLVGAVEIRGDLHVTSVFAAGLPASDNIAGVPGSELLKAPLLPKSKKLALFIGVFSSSSNFDRRMAQRKSWMQYETVRSGDVAVRFFVGLHKQEQVNKELWDEAQTFGDLQLLPFVDYYYLITLKTAAICIYVTKFLKADYVMKTDDDTFVRVDMVLSLLQNRDPEQSFLLGEVETDSSPSRDRNSKWYISPETYSSYVLLYANVMYISASCPENHCLLLPIQYTQYLTTDHIQPQQEWPYEKYPPWAHGPGYIFSNDMADFVSRFCDSPQLKLFKLEDVAMGIWVEEFQRSQNRSVAYVHNGKFISGGCVEDYVIAHYQTPRQMMCLWNQLQQVQIAVCCD